MIRGWRQSDAGHDGGARWTLTARLLDHRMTSPPALLGYTKDQVVGEDTVATKATWISARDLAMSGKPLTDSTLDYLRTAPFIYASSRKTTGSVEKKCNGCWYSTIQMPPYIYRLKLKSLVQISRILSKIMENGKLCLHNGDYASEVKYMGFSSHCFFSYILFIF